MEIGTTITIQKTLRQKEGHANENLTSQEKRETIRKQENTKADVAEHTGKIEKIWGGKSIDFPFLSQCKFDALFIIAVSHYLTYI